ncbi:L-histidine N(alpha)-methyltransferase [Cupriavidus respiraculi]|uniref:Histidine N-alpha-methyltransferase n=1 Tax=Cupriavidus respiraculi TaxID=195930 RepID=A0ABM8XER3_9BURK|nr:L-histidine N(alpha)-methyltransferase [Cupriavidus respiraculi]MBY4948737.1 L-histidine N(alpha)-methyltransferase [Cupriavidus respiraculi]CAG9178452.1 Histidine N-alpha-methyltransferase [Cupriavidus respiraculi]
MPALPTPLNPRQADRESTTHPRHTRTATQGAPATAAAVVPLANGHAGPGRLQFVQQYHEDNAALRAEVLHGLQSERASISPKFFYDVLGSRLFEAITELPEYYPTRTEARIFSDSAADIAARAGRGGVLIDLGAGNCQKAARLFPSLQPAQYVAVDISVEFLRGTLTGLQQQHPQIPMLGLGADLCAPLDLPPTVRRGRRLFFYPGSSIGNFAPVEALALLQRLRAAAEQGDGVLIGVDLLKDEAPLVAAYDDALGVTAAFNRNVLRNVNRIVGSDFSLGDWRHVARFDRESFRIEMLLEAERDIAVAWQGGARTFRKGERIHTEDSYKYRPEDFSLLLEAAGFSDPVCWTDPAGWFAMFHARA